MNSLQKNQFGLALVAILIILRFVLVPWLDWLDAKAAQVSQLATSVQRFQNVTQRHSLLVEKQQQIQESYRQLDKLWASGSEQQNSLAVLQYIEGAAKQHNISLKNRSARDAVVAKTTSIPVRMFAEGTPEALVNFIVQLETGQPKILIRKLTLTKPNKLSKVLVANFEMIVVAKPIQVDNAQ